MNEYMMIDHSVEVKTDNLPKIIQSTIKDLEKYDREGDWASYDSVSTSFYALIKAAYSENLIGKNKYVQLINKYGGDYE